MNSVSLTTGRNLYLVTNCLGSDYYSYSINLLLNSKNPIFKPKFHLLAAAL